MTENINIIINIAGFLITIGTLAFYLGKQSEIVKNVTAKTKELEEYVTREVDVIHSELTKIKTDRFTCQNGMGTRIQNAENQISNMQAAFQEFKQSIHIMIQELKSIMAELNQKIEAPKHKR